VVDCGNVKVKLFTVTAHLIDQLRMSSEPCDVAVIDSSTAAVTLPEEELIQFISVKDGRNNRNFSAMSVNDSVVYRDGLSITRSIAASGKCKGISCGLQIGRDIRSRQWTSIG
jgi:hypothetical protein